MNAEEKFDAPTKAANNVKNQIINGTELKEKQPL